jgi:hypothetical protein
MDGWMDGWMDREQKAKRERFELQKYKLMNGLTWYTAAAA